MKIRNPRNTEWDKYITSFEELFNEMDKRLVSKHSFERIADDLELAFKISYEKSCRETVVKTNRNVPRWNSELSEMRKKVRKLERIAFSKRLKLQGSQVEREKALKNYKEALTITTKI